MEKKYRKIEFDFGNIEDAIKKLQSYNGELVCGVFNGTTLYSDVDDIDFAYQKIVGMSKKEQDLLVKKQHGKYEEQKRKHKAAIPELEKEWIAKGDTILDEKYRELWAKCVPIRLGDLYQGMELGMCLDIVLELNNGCTLDKAKDIIKSQGHSGMSFGLICSMISSFCDRGKEFIEYARK